MSKINGELKDVQERSKLREDLIERIVKNSEIIQNFPDRENFLVLSRQWNSWYPSSLDVEGGCYFFNINEEIIIIDPGFNTIEEIKRNQLDIRLIRHVFITHFHPDHFESLVKILTRITSKNNAITVYMNPTAFEQFKIYSKEYTDFIELKPGMLLKLAFNKKNPNIIVNVEVSTAYHKEIGGANNSIGLKFEIKDKNIDKVHSIGFMSDTDGSEKYINEYCSFYGDCDILIMHIGSIATDKHPTGYKHLYKDGIISLFNCLSDQKLLENKLIFIGEFGFELAPIDYFRKVCEAIIPERMNYFTIINSFLDFLTKNEPESSLGFIYISSFKKCIEKIDLLYPTLEIIAPFFFNIKDNLDAIIKEQIAKIDVKDVQIQKIWDLLTQTIVFESLEPLTGKEELEKIGFKVFGKEVVEEYYAKIHNFFKYMNSLIANWLLNRFRSNDLIDFFNSEDGLQYIKYYVKDLNYEESFLEWERDFRELLSFSKRGRLWKLGEEEKHKLHIITLLIFSLFMIYLANFDDFMYPQYGEVDGRQTICKVLYNNFMFGTLGLVLPVHPSYRIIFAKEIEIQGSCSNGHRNVRFSISNYNRDWKIIRKIHSSPIESDSEFLDVIPEYNCGFCVRDSIERDNGMPEEELERESIEVMRVIEAQFEAELEKINKMINDTKDIIDLALTLALIKKPVLLAFIDTDLLMDKINTLRKDVSNEEILKIFFTSENFLDVPHVRSLIAKIVEEEASKDEKYVKNLILSLLSNDIADSDEKIYYSFFDNDDLADALIKYQPEFNLEEIIEISNYYIGKMKYMESEGKYPSPNSMFFFYKRQFINLFYKILKSWETHTEELELIFSKSEFFNRLHTLPQPINLYAKWIKEVRFRYIMRTRRT